MDGHYSGMVPSYTQLTGHVLLPCRRITLADFYRAGFHLTNFSDAVFLKRFIFTIKQHDMFADRGSAATAYRGSPNPVGRTSRSRKTWFLSNANQQQLAARQRTARGAKSPSLHYFHKATNENGINGFVHRIKPQFSSGDEIGSVSIRHQKKILLHISHDQARRVAGHASRSIKRPVLHYFR